MAIIIIIMRNGHHDFFAQLSGVEMMPAKRLIEGERGRFRRWDQQGVIGRAPSLARLICT